MSGSCCKPAIIPLSTDGFAIMFAVPKPASTHQEPPSSSRRSCMCVPSYSASPSRVQHVCRARDTISRDTHRHTRHEHASTCCAAFYAAHWRDTSAHDDDDERPDRPTDNKLRRRPIIIIRTRPKTSKHARAMATREQQTRRPTTTSHARTDRAPDESLAPTVVAIVSLTFCFARPAAIAIETEHG